MLCYTCPASLIRRNILQTNALSSMKLQKQHHKMECIRFDNYFCNVDWQQFVKIISQYQIQYCRHSALIHVSVRSEFHYRDEGGSV